MPFEIMFEDETTVQLSKSGKSKLVSIPGTAKAPRAKKAKEEKERGCNVCPLNKVKGINKIMGTVDPKKKILLIAQSPGPRENEKKRELLGPAGKWWWTELDRVGLTRDDVSVQNAVRCFPADRVFDKEWGSHSLVMRNPAPEEIRCCSIHTEAALEKAKASYIVILGAVAAKIVLGVRSLPANKIFYADKLKAKVYLLDHPAFFIRGYGHGPRLKQFRATLRQLKTDLDSGQDASDRFAFLRNNDYRAIVNEKQAQEAAAIIREAASKGLRAAVDIEDDERDGKRYIACCGFSVRPKQAFVFIIDHPDVPKKDALAVRYVLEKLLGDSKIEKALQYGCSDVAKLWKQAHIRVRGWTHDTMLSEYLRWSDRKAYGLVAIYTARFPMFSGYEMVVVDEMLQGVDVPPKIANGSLEERYKFLEGSKLFSIAKLSIETLTLYNGGDCDLTKRIEMDNKKHISSALMRLYIDLSRLLYKMEPQGPLFDYTQAEKLEKVYPSRARYYKEKLIRLLKGKELVIKKRNKAGIWTSRKILAKDYNPGSPEQVVAALYGTLGLPQLSPKPDTRERTLLMLGRKYAFPNVQLKWRSFSKAKSTLESYVRCAKANVDRLRTKWHAAGARTGRLRSGGSRNKNEPVVNLQNIKKDPHVQNMCVADVEWRTFFNAAEKLLENYPLLTAFWKILQKWDLLPLDKRKAVLKPVPDDKATVQLSKFGAALEAWVRKHMPDLKTYLLLDYGQVEVRVMAQMSGDKNLIKDCMESDIHTRVGCIAEGSLVLTDQGRIPIEHVKLDMRVWDGIEYVEHNGVVFQGVREVITYEGLTTTPEHEVWTNRGKLQLAAASARGARLVTTGSEDLPVRYVDDNLDQYPLQGLSASSVGGVQQMPPEEGNLCGSYYKGQFDHLQMQLYLQRSTSSFTLPAVSRHTKALQTRRKELRRAWDTKQVQIGANICGVCIEGAAPPNLSGCSIRQDRQQRSLRIRQFEALNFSATGSQQEKQQVDGVQGQQGNRSRFSQAIETGLSVFNTKRRKHLASTDARRDVGVTSKKVRVYDIVNAGPRRRFTVSGRLVSNCTMTGWDADRIMYDEETRTLTKNVHFGIMFGLNEHGLYEFVKAMSPVDMRDRISQEQISEAVKKYFKRYPGVKVFQEEQRDFAQANGYVETLFGMKQVLNVTDESRPSLDEVVEDDEDGRSSWWGNQAINGPVQGTAHQLVICALVNLLRKRLKYATLGIPPTEVHDAVYFGVRVLSLPEAYKKATYLLEKESIKTSEQDFKIKWNIPIVTDAKAGLRLGCKIKVNEKTTISAFLASWFYECRKQETQLEADFASAVAEAIISG